MKKRLTKLQQEGRKAIREILKKDTQLAEQFKEHQRLLKLVKTFPQDYEPFGKVTEYDRRNKWVDCSMGCKWFRPLEGELGMDWGVCTNVKSHRVGLLTFEHQGCLQGEVLTPAQGDVVHYGIPQK